MADRSAIEWCDSTFNPWTGCTKISPACDHCYAEALSRRAPKTIAQWGAGVPRRRTSVGNWKKPLRWNATPFFECTGCGWRGDAAHDYDRLCPTCRSKVHPARRRVFCASLADVFDNEVDPQWREDLFNLIYRTSKLDWLLLTKRIGNVAAMLSEIKFPADGGLAALDLMPLHSVWLGATICNQAEADRDIPKLLQVPARFRFLSIEPMLGPVDLTRLPLGRDMNIDWASDAPPHLRRIRTVKLTLDALRGAPVSGVPGLNWVIAGGESGAHARPSHPDWFRSLRDQCAAAGVPFFMKQMGGVRDKRGKLDDLPDDLRIRSFP